MPSRDVYKQKLTAHGSTQRDRTVNLVKSDISKNVIFSPSYKTVLINELEEQNLEIVATQTDNKKRFTTMPDEIISLGDLLTWNGMHWIVTKVDFDDEIVRRGEIEQCNRIIQWQNKKTLEIIERWCLCYNPYSSNLDDDKIAPTLNGKYEVKVPLDAETMQVGTGRRFLLDIVDDVPMAYKLTFPDVDSNKYQDSEGGFIVWNLVSDTFNVNEDSRELMVADYVYYVEHPVPPPVDPTLLICSITGRNDIKIGGSPRNYTAHFYEADGVTEVLDGSVTAEWELVADPAHTADFEFVSNGNSMSISVPENDAAIGQKALLKLKDAGGLYQPAELWLEAELM